MTNIQCRLCSSTRTLISLFNGKCRQNRDYIRKLIDVTIGIKFQKNDARTCICYACTIQIYNFYIFKYRSIENERRLQIYAEDEENIKLHNVEIPDIDDIILPGIEELKENLNPWLISKQQYCETEINEDDRNQFNSIDGNHNSNKPNDAELTNTSTQYDLVNCIDRGTQYQLSTSEIFTQTSKLSTNSVRIQCDLVKVESKESPTQTIDVNIVHKTDKTAQTEFSNTHNKKLTKTSKIQCDLIKLNQETPKRECLNSSTQTSEKSNLSITAGLTYNNLMKNALNSDERLANRNWKFLNKKCKESELSVENTTIASNLKEILSKECQCEVFSTEMSTQTSKPVIVSKESCTQTKKESKTCRCSNNETSHNDASEKHARPKRLAAEAIKDYSKFAKILRVKTRHSGTQTDFNCESDLDGPYIDDIEDVYIDISKNNMRLNLDVKQELNTPPILSPANEYGDSSKNDEILNFSSPKLSTSLLALKDKTQTVIICPECDKTMYSKNQYRLHRKNHMRCTFCKKKFTSVKKTKLHVEYECEVQKLTKTVPVVTLVRLEHLTDVQKRYPYCLDLIRGLPKFEGSDEKEDIKKMVRIRSRSVSDMDSFINCTSCRGCISILKGISVGIDKSVQANYILDQDLIISPLEFIYKNMSLKRDSSISNERPSKKIKLLPPISNK